MTSRNGMQCPVVCPSGVCCRIIRSLECSNYTGDAHTRCPQAFIEIQREKSPNWKRKSSSSKSTVGQLKDRADRQNAMTAELQRQMSQQSSAPSSLCIRVPRNCARIVVRIPVRRFRPVPRTPWIYGVLFYARPMPGDRVITVPITDGGIAAGRPFATLRPAAVVHLSGSSAFAVVQSSLLSIHLHNGG